MTARIKAAQRDDETLKEKIELAIEGKLDGYSMQRGVLYKNVGDETRVVLPRSMQFQVIRKAHERGHFGVAKKEAILTNECWIPSLRLKVEKVVRNCIACILAERQHGKQPGFLSSIEKGSVPIDTYHVDHLGPLQSSRKSYAHVLVVIDVFSKFVWLYACKSTTTAEVITILRKQAVTFANPRRIISDRGTAFSSREFEAYCNEEGIEHILTTTGIPRGNGQVERVNRTLIPMLTKLAAPRPSEWYRYLADVQSCLNTTPHRSTEMTPYKIMFGVNARLKTDLKISEFLNEEMMLSFDAERDELRQAARAAIQRVQEENKRNFNKNRKQAFQYRTGDIVAIKRTQQGPGNKFANKFLGPYEVIRVLRHDRYLVRKIGETEGPRQTSSAADSMKLWTVGGDEEEADADEDEDHRVEGLIRTAECGSGNSAQ